MSHTHIYKTARTILGSELHECACGARKWSNDRPMLGGVLDAQGWYVAEAPTETREEAARRRAVEMLQTEGYGYDWNKQDANDPLDSHDPRNQD